MVSGPPDPRPRPCGLRPAVHAHLLQQAQHVCVRVQEQGKGLGQGLLILQTAGIELAPELVLQISEVLLGELVLCHTAVELKTEEKLKLTSGGIWNLSPPNRDCPLGLYEP